MTQLIDNLTPETFGGVINLNGLRSVIIKACNKELQRTNWNLPVITTNILHEFDGTFHYMVFHSDDGITPHEYMHRFHILVYSYLMCDCIYKDSNVTDRKHITILDDVKLRFKGYVDSLYKDLNK